MKMRRHLTSIILLAAVLFSGCAQDPTTSSEYQALLAQVAAAEESLADAEARAASADAQAAAVVLDDGLVAEARAIQTEWTAAWNADDGDAVRSMMAAGGRHYCLATGSQGVSGAELGAFVEEGWHATDVEIVSVTCTDVPGETTADCLVATAMTLNGHRGHSAVLHLRGPEGALRVLTHHAYVG